MGWGCRIKANCSLVGSEPVGEVSSLRGGLSKGYYNLFMRVLEKTKENYDRIGRQAKPGIEPSISRLLVLSTKPLGHWWGLSVLKSNSGNTLNLTTIITE